MSGFLSGVMLIYLRDLKGVAADGLLDSAWKRISWRRRKGPKQAYTRRHLWISLPQEDWATLSWFGALVREKTLGKAASRLIEEILDFHRKQVMAKLETEDGWPEED
jgi:hypothetical protein